MTKNDPQQEFEQYRSITTRYKANYIMVGDKKWEYVVGGKGVDPVVIIPGNFASFEIMFSLIFDLEDQFKIISPSFPPANPRSFEEFNQGLNAILDAENIPSVNLIGRSVGGYKALGYALKNSERVKKLIFSQSPMPSREGLEKTAKIRKALKWFFFDEMFFYPSKLAFYLKVRPNYLKTLQEHDLNTDFYSVYCKDLFYLKNSLERVKASFDFFHYIGNCVDEIESEIKNLTMPTLVIESDNDRDIRFLQGGKPGLKNYLKNVQVKCYPGTYGFVA